MRKYVALLYKDPKSDFGVSFPACPGCITAGSTFKEAKDMAREALPFQHLRYLLNVVIGMPKGAF